MSKLNENVSSQSISESDRINLIESALQARSLSYSPYSKFRVGAAILTKEKEIILGANVENASYGATICAERTAFVKAITTSSSSKSFIAVAIAGDIDNHCSPCGICRQFMREFCRLDMPVYLPFSSWSKSNDVQEKTIKEMTLGGLLPLSFGPEDLERERV